MVEIFEKNHLNHRVDEKSTPSFRNEGGAKKVKECVRVLFSEENRKKDRADEVRFYLSLLRYENGSCVVLRASTTTELFNGEVSLFACDAFDFQ